MGRQRRLVSPGRTVTFEGARYKAERKIFGCEGCAFANRPYGCDDMPMCVDEKTEEGVIFIEVEPN